MWLTVLGAVLAYVPALVSNSLAVVFGGGTPMDFGFELKDGRLLGDGKTWRGFIGGGLSAALIGLVLALLLGDHLPMYPPSCRAVWIIMALSFGALLGDVGASFFKRRSGRERGKKTPVVDQYDFILGSFLAVILTAPDWTLNTYFRGDGIWAMMIILIGSPLLHKAVNVIGYRLGYKEEPW